jgi:hypothetical protein
VSQTGLEHQTVAYEKSEAQNVHTTQLFWFLLVLAASTARHK